MSQPDIFVDEEPGNVVSIVSFDANPTYRSSFNDSVTTSVGYNLYKHEPDTFVMMRFLDICTSNNIVPISQVD